MSCAMAMLARALSVGSRLNFWKTNPILLSHMRNCGKRVRLTTACLICRGRELCSHHQLQWNQRGRPGPRCAFSFGDCASRKGETNMSAHEFQSEIQVASWGRIHRAWLYV